MQSSTRNITLTFAAIIIILAGFMAAKSIILPMLLALFISIICTQPILWLEKHRVPYTLAIVLVLTGVASVLILFGSIIGRSISNFMRDLPRYEANLRNIFAASIDRIDNISGIDIDSTQLVDMLDPGRIISFTTGAVGEFGRIMSDSFVILLITIFILLEAKSFIKKATILKRLHKISIDHMDKIAQSIRHYLSLKTVISALTGLFIWIWLLIQGVEYAILWGVIAFLLNYIPNIGSIIAAVPTSLLAMLQFGWGGMLWTIFGYLLVNTIMGNIVEPKIIGRGLGLSTLVVFLSLIIWGFIFGPVGMFLSVPLTMTIKIILEEREKTKWIATLLGDEYEAKQLLKNTDGVD
ncbi:MAG: AI-2E family transporter [Bacteroidales bacterium]|nr:AI-2E family transporter [Bacteroidales bacterium]